MDTHPLPIQEPVVIASHNPGKLLEIRALLHGISQKSMSAQALHLSSPAETEATFEGNAHLKAIKASNATQKVALADDSGLCVDVLEGRPGIHSARWAREAGGWTEAQEKLQKALDESGQGGGPVTAKLHCSLAIAWPSGYTRVFSGQVQGELVWPPRGENGSGFDAMFVPEGYIETFAEMSPTAKSKIDARSVAFSKLKEELVDAGFSETAISTDAASPGV